jgi:3-oxosteroid 1-dehydrogenase
VRGVELASGRQLTAARGVVLATGGYEWNAELMRDLDPLPGLQPQSSPGSTGDGLIMGTEIGAALRRTQNNLNLMLGFTLVLDDPGAQPIGCMAGITELCSPHTIVVNTRGRRFGDESYFQSLVPALRTFDTMRHAYANLPCFLIFDQQYAENYSLASLPAGQAMPRSVAHAHSIEDLARTMGIDSTGLKSTIDRFNGFVIRGIDEDFHRGTLRWRLAHRDTAPPANASLGTLAKPPFYGLALHPTLGTTSAGLLTDKNGQVIHQRRMPIAGLYASGIVAARSELGAGYQAGLNLASGMTFSYLAVRHMLKQSAA